MVIQPPCIDEEKKAEKEKDEKEEKTRMTDTDTR